MGHANPQGGLVKIPRSKKFQTKTIAQLKYILSLLQPHYKLALGCDKPCKVRHYPVKSNEKKFRQQKKRPTNLLKT